VKKTEPLARFIYEQDVFPGKKKQNFGEK